MALPRRASQLPLTAISLGLQAWEHSRGLREFALRRGNEALQIASMTPLGRLLPKQLIDDGADEEAARIVADARSETAAASKPATAKPATPKAATPTAGAAKPQAAKSQAAKPQAVKPAKPAEPPAAAKEVGAPGAVTEEVEQIAEKLHVEAPETRDELPIPDFDNISLGSLRARLRSLSIEQLVVLRDWEQAHANRLQVITTLDNRIAKLGTDSAAAGSSGSNGTPAGNGQPADVGAKGTDYPSEAVAAERAAESEGGTLRI
jgi:hypothetical protein